MVRLENLIDALLRNFLVFRACRALFLHVAVAKKHCEGSQTVFFNLEPKLGLGKKDVQNYHLMTQFFFDVLRCFCMFISFLKGVA